MGIEHDDWLQSFGIDVGQLRADTGGSNPSIDPTLAPALVATGEEFGKGFVKGVGDTLSGIANSAPVKAAGAIVSGPTGFLGNVINAEVTGDPTKLAPDIGLGGLKFDPKDPNQVKNAQAQVDSSTTLALGLLMPDTIGIRTALDLPTAVDAIVHGDPNQVGQAAGKTTVLVGLAVGGGALAEGGCRC